MSLGNHFYILYRISFPNNKFYIGITKDFDRRKAEHLYDMRKGRKHLLYYAMNKYRDEFKIEPINFAICKEMAIYIERLYIEEYDSFNNGYRALGGYGIN